MIFFFNDTATTEIYTLSLHDALPICNIANLFLDEWIHAKEAPDYLACMKKAFRAYSIELAACADLRDREKEFEFLDRKSTRLNSSHANISYAVFCLKKNKTIQHTQQT